MANKIFVGNLPYDATEDDLRTLFEGQDLTYLKILHTEAGESRGFGYVSFSNRDDYENALRRQTGILNGRTIRFDQADDKNSTRTQRPAHNRQPDRFERPHGRSDRFERQPASHRGGYGHRPPVAIDQNKPRWWVALGQPPSREPEDPQGFPGITSFNIDMPDGCDSIHFFPLKVNPRLLPADAYADLQRGYVLCVPGVGPQDVKQEILAPVDELLTLSESVSPFLDNATEYGAAVAASVNFGSVLFVCPMGLADMDVKSTDVAAMLSEHYIRHVFLEHIHPTVDRPGLVEALSLDPAWSYDSTTVTVDATYLDQRVACYLVDADGRVIADHDSADALAVTCDHRAVTAQELDQRAVVCELAPDGRLRLPPVNSSDLRIIGDKALSKQTNARHELLQHPSGWYTDLTTVAKFDHEERYKSEQRPEMSLAIRRKHLFKDMEPATEANPQEYPVFKALYLCPSRLMSYVLVLSEVPPTEGAEADYPSESNGQATIIALEGLEHARNLAMRLPEFLPPNLLAKQAMQR
eukprot:TRINITY_DN11071_c0_g1_i1.p1 TRINITY_DN11071_c0_g1~~TRINITY_DN11071_c0_g1_i1.p1  ORF type:complete len:525 (+),score=99.82 TRINITY_DN11071_c0_g1_i1:40-1614(+)